MIKTFIEQNHYVFHQKFDSWEEAVRASCVPLLEDTTIEQPYVESIIACIKEYGPYIVIAPDIAMPHSTENAAGVNKTAISFMKVETPVVFDEADREKDARLFFVLAAQDHEAHLDNMVRLSEMLMDDQIVEQLLACTCVEDLQRLV